MAPGGGGGGSSKTWWIVAVAIVGSFLIGFQTAMMRGHSASLERRNRPAQEGGGGPHFRHRNQVADDAFHKLQEAIQHVQEKPIGLQGKEILDEEREQKKILMEGEGRRKEVEQEVKKIGAGGQEDNNDDEGHNDKNHEQQREEGETANDNNHDNDGGVISGGALPTLESGAVDLSRKDLMIDLEDLSMNKKCEHPPEKESSSNVAFMREFGRIFKHNFSNLPWHLDEGGLIGSSRAGAMANADDDFDFFAILPNQNNPCGHGTPHCTRAEFDVFIHKFLLVFWEEGMCINKFHPDPKKFVSKSRLMYSFQLGRRKREGKSGSNPLQCFQEKIPFAHMHLGMLSDNGQEILTNIWVPKESTHSKDSLPLSLMLPVKRCRAGGVDAPCPNDPVGFLTVRNQGEYRKRSGDGSCLLVRNKWGMARKKGQVDRVRNLASCGYASMVELADPFEKSGYKSC